MKEDRILFLPEKTSVPWWSQGFEGTKCCTTEWGEMPREGKWQLVPLRARHCSGLARVFCQHPSAPRFDNNCILRNWVWEVGTFTIYFAKQIIARVISLTPIQQPAKPRVFPWCFQQKGRSWVDGKGAHWHSFWQPLNLQLSVVFIWYKRNFAFFSNYFSVIH